MPALKFDDGSQIYESPDASAGHLGAAEGNPLAQPITLPHCGRTLRNRLVKLSMAECLAKYGGKMDLAAFERLYAEWARGDWAIVITGNVQVDPRYSSLPWDVRLPWNLAAPPASRVHADERSQPWASLASTFRSSRSSTGQSQIPQPLFIVQLNHPGRQCPLSCRPSISRPIAPSPVKVNAQDGSLASALFNQLVFRTPREMEDEEVEELCRRFGEAAGFLERCGVDGVQLHGGHGYLISQFLSPLANLRQPSSPFAFRPSNSAHAHHLLRRLLHHVRSHTSSSFVLGLKLVCSEFVEGGLTVDDALEQVMAARAMTVPVRRNGQDEQEEGYDFVEISGGNYANPVFTSTSGPQTAFAAFTTKVLALQPGPGLALVLLSGSLRTQKSLRCALAEDQRAADLLGFGRPSVLHPQLPRTHLLASPPLDVPTHRIVNYDLWSSVFSLGGRVKIVGGGVGTLWWDWQMGRIARGEGVKPEMGVLEGALAEYVDPRVALVLLSLLFALLALLLAL